MFLSSGELERISLFDWYQRPVVHLAVSGEPWEMAWSQPLAPHSYLLPNLWIQEWTAFEPGGFMESNNP